MNWPVIVSFVGTSIELGKMVRDLLRACRAGDEQARKVQIDAIAVESERLTRKAAN